MPLSIFNQNLTFQIMKKLILLFLAFANALSLFSQFGRIFPGDTITFENANAKYVSIDTSKSNIWQIGKPDKTFFISAYSKPNAIVTDTTGFYPVNNYSYFDIIIGSFNITNYPQSIFVSMEHKFDTDTLKDGGYISVSWDNGATFTNIIEDSDYPGITPMDSFLANYNIDINLYGKGNTLYNGEYGFSGKSNDWIKTQFAWSYVLTALPIDTMILRFNFISDSINSNKEGWLIDNIELFREDLPGSLFNATTNDLITISPNPACDNIVINTIMNPSNESTISILSISGKLMMSDHFNIYPKVLDIGSLQSGIYLIKISNGQEVFLKKLIKE